MKNSLRFEASSPPNHELSVAAALRLPVVELCLLSWMLIKYKETKSGSTVVLLSAPVCLTCV